MTEMKFKFTIQEYQTEAVSSVVGVFAGQPFKNRVTYRRDVPTETETNLFSDEDSYLGFANAKVSLSNDDLHKNICEIQSRNNIKQSGTLARHELGRCSLDIEMETGTGKTYVYIKTIFELNKQYGWSKFIVVVPSIAIREGVRKSFETTQDHFMEYYGKKARFFIYDSKNLGAIDDFSQSADINVMIINIQSFNARGEDARRIRTELDSFGSRKPIDVIKANNPIIILDEPQKMGGAATQASLQEFNPLFCLNYSATHKDHHDMVYVLDALDAYNQKLVKRIEVKGFDVHNLSGTDEYLFFENIIISPKKMPRARIEFEVRHNNGVKREIRVLSKNDDLFALSKNMQQYRGYCISDIDPFSGAVTFTNGKTIHTGEVYGDISESNLRRIQIRETIRSHFEKEKEMFSRGVKTLSLFFIDEVAKYRKYDENGEEVNSEYGDIFEQEYTKILNENLTLFDPQYMEYLRKIDVQKTHAGYFSIDRKGHKVDSAIKRGRDISDDISAYDLILKDKERLLSFESPVRFIFSHSALREGWDNPNVFQICTLKHGGSSPVQKRQEVGRGLRLCVNQNGVRMDRDAIGGDVHQINKLTVIASEGYAGFVSSLQQGIREDLYDRPTTASEEYFWDKVIPHSDGRRITHREASAIYNYLVRNYYVDDDKHITSKYREELSQGALALLPEKLQNVSEGIHTLIQAIFDESVLNTIIDDASKTKVYENALNDNFYKKEFQTLWNYINHKYAYTVEFDGEELIANAIRHINEKMIVAELRYTVTTGELPTDLSHSRVTSGTGFSTGSSKTYTLDYSKNSSIKYDLIGEIAGGTKLTRKSVAKILSGITPDTFDKFKKNPEEFISKAIRLINEQKATMIVEQISYNRTEGTYDSTIFTAEKNSDFSRAYEAKKNVQDYVFADGYAKDGKSIERKFAEDMDAAEEVCVYAKLPKGFHIPTPVGNYSPDWAIAFNKGTVKHIFFIAETKGTMNSLSLRPIETAKIKCAKKLFKELSTKDVVYESVDSYQALLDVMENL